ncbi:Methionine ABC transporter ATP-binding protein [Dissulfuribacter thermophilus]|uniref:Methionine ABC transporter ATP-binding protein n=1 Tax=Dissulfuribacter thermophilus TaxID=1156395 RepID=A0A1B9F582_9BACT|nr:ATP-binding cassette domain-containing protein [Dissulfuribacter thermophilus]OCC15109.1 Methionine ABC transporter ATP-binding protein [Dissulfuribacter thermophilus]
MAQKTPLIEFVDVKKAFGEKVVLDGVSCAFYEGEITTIIGKSGVGKSVFLKHIVGLLKPDSGQIRVRGVPLSKMDRESLKAFKKSISYMFQSNALFDSMTIYENIALPLVERRQLTKAQIDEKVRSKVEQLELGDVLSKYPSQISGGMQKRVALARALITDPKIVLFDEPTAGLDPLRKNAVFSMVHHYQKSFGFTGIIVSHDIPDVFYISDRVAILEGGKIIFQGSPMALEQSPDPTVKLFIGGEMGLIDELTGLLTRAEMEYRVRHEMVLREARGVPMKMGLFSVGNLEEIDEHVGHIASHKIFQCLAGELIEFFGKNVVAGRCGPSEILVLFPITGNKFSEGFLKELSQRLKKKPFLQKNTYSRVCRDFNIRGAVREFRGKKSFEEIICNLRESLKDIAALRCNRESNNE